MRFFCVILCTMYLMCGPRQLFLFQCGPEMSKGWTPLLEKVSKPQHRKGEPQGFSELRRQRWESWEARLLEFTGQRTREEGYTEGECQRSSERPLEFSGDQCIVCGWRKNHVKRLGGMMTGS